MASSFPGLLSWPSAIVLATVMVVAPLSASAQPRDPRDVETQQLGPADPGAQDPAPDTPRLQKKLPGAPGKLPKVGSADHGRGLDFLLDALKVAPDEDSAKYVEARIWALWMQTPSDTAA